MGDLLSVGYGSAGVSTFPEQWARLSLIDSLDEPLSSQVSQEFDDMLVARTGHIVGLVVRLNAAFDDGTATITLTVNGAPQTLQAVLTAGQTEATITQATGIDTISEDDVVGLNLETSGDFDWSTPINLEAWLEVATATTGGGGGGGGDPWLQLDPTVYIATFNAVPGYVHQLGAPGKGAQITLPVSVSGEDVIALKGVDPSYGWSVAGIQTVDGLTAWQPSPENNWIILISAGDGVNWYSISNNRSLRVQNSGGLSIPDSFQKFGQLDFYHPILVDASVGLGRAQVFIGGYQVVVGAAVGIAILLQSLEGRPAIVYSYDTSVATNIELNQASGLIPGRMYWIKNRTSSVASLTVFPASGSGDTIDGAASVVLAPGEGAIFVADGVDNWEVF